MTVEADSRVFGLTLTGRLGLDFANTVDWRTSEQPDEFITSYPDLAHWSQHAGLLTQAEARRLLREAARRPREANSVLDEAKNLREAIFRIFSTLAAGRQPEEDDLALLNAELSEALAHLRITRRETGFGWGWKGGEDRLNRMLWAVARSAGEVLVDEEGLALLRECANQECGWLFVDTSRNKSRRWCNMNVCGNRVKARRHYEQVKATR